jgi:hypothetical protein
MSRESRRNTFRVRLTSIEHLRTPVRDSTWAAPSASTVGMDLPSRFTDLIVSGPVSCVLAAFESAHCRSTCNGIRFLGISRRYGVLQRVLTTRINVLIGARPRLMCTRGAGVIRRPPVRSSGSARTTKCLNHVSRPGIRRDRPTVGVAGSVAGPVFARQARYLQVASCPWLCICAASSARPRDHLRPHGKERSGGLLPFRALTDQIPIYVGPPGEAERALLASAILLRCGRHSVSVL